MTPKKKHLDKSFVVAVEKSHFRTVHDTGANTNALFVWNLVRQHVGLPRLSLSDLPAWCDKCKKYHVITESEKCSD